MGNAIDAWKQIEHLSAELVALAEKGEWEPLEEQIATRDAAIAQLIDKTVEPAEADAVRALLAQIKAHNATLERLAETQRKNTLEALRKSGSGNKMKAAYTKVQRSR